MARRRLPRSFYARPCLEVARGLVGKFLVRRLEGTARVGRIVEVEAYCGPDDLASHARRGPTPRARIMFGPPGYAYVYLIYGMHHCLNVVCDRDGFPAAILIRAVEPVDNVTRDTRGPGRVCAAMQITLAENGADLTRGDLWIEERESAAPRLEATPRIGIDYAGVWAERPWRWIDVDSPWLSRKRASENAS